MRTCAHTHTDIHTYTNLFTHTFNGFLYRKFLSEVLGFQFLRAFCLASGQYQPGVAEFPMHNCDFYGCTKAGNLIKYVKALADKKESKTIKKACAQSI